MLRKPRHDEDVFRDVLHQAGVEPHDNALLQLGKRLDEGGHEELWNIFGLETCVAEAKEHHSILCSIDKLLEFSLQWPPFSQVHSSHILGVGGDQLGIVDEEVGVDEAEVDVMDELGGGDEVGEVALDVNVGSSCLPQLQHLVFKLVMQIAELIKLIQTSKIKCKKQASNLR